MANTPPASTEADKAETQDSGTGPTPTAALVASTPDPRDTARRVPKSKLDGPRVRAISTHGGTTIKVSAKDFENLGVKHHQVVWDFRKDKLTVPVGNRPGEISVDAAEALFDHEPQRFEPVNWD